MMFLAHTASACQLSTNTRSTEQRSKQVMLSAHCRHECSHPPAMHTCLLPNHLWHFEQKSGTPVTHPWQEHSHQFWFSPPT